MKRGVLAPFSLLVRRENRLLVAAILVALGGGEVLVRLVLPRPGVLEFTGADTGVLVQDSVLGYKYGANIRRHIVTPDYEMDFATNDLGMRDSPLDSGPPPRIRILAVGDSYTLGLGNEADEVWPKRLQALIAGSRVYNAGVSGYGLPQMRLTAEALRPRVRPDLIVVGVYGDGYYRIGDPYVVVSSGAMPLSKSAADRVKLTNGGVLEPAFATPLLRDATFWLDRHWYLAGHVAHLVSMASGAVRKGFGPPLPPPAPISARMAPLLDELLRFQRFADSANVPLAALLINPQLPTGAWSPDEFAYNEIITTFGREHGVCVIDPLPELERAAKGQPRFRFRDNRHWNPAAQALAADVVARTLLGRPGKEGGALPTPAHCRPASAALRDTHGRIR